jgi:hypothetical protein
MLPSDNSLIFSKNFVEKLKNGTAQAKLWRCEAGLRLIFRKKAPDSSSGALE